MAVPKKNFKLAAEEIKPIATGYGGCIASDMITCGGYKVGYMYRESPYNDIDSGWCFLSGLETDEIMDDASQHGVYDVNTIANYDPEIIPFLSAELGSAFARQNGIGPFVKVRGFELEVD